MRKDILNHTTIRQDQCRTPQEPTDIRIGWGVQHPMIRLIRFYTDSNDILLIPLQILRHIQIIRMPVVNYGNRLSIYPNFTAGVYCFQLEYGTLEVGEANLFPQIIALFLFPQAAMR